MLKNLCQLEHMIEDKVFHFVCAHDAPLNFIKEALFQMQKYVGLVEEAALKQREEAEASKAENQKQSIPEVEEHVG